MSGAPAQAGAFLHFSFESLAVHGGEEVSLPYPPFGLFYLLSSS